MRRACKSFWTKSAFMNFRLITLKSMVICLRELKQLFAIGRSVGTQQLRPTWTNSSAFAMASIRRSGTLSSTKPCPGKDPCFPVLHSSLWALPRLACTKNMWLGGRLARAVESSPCTKHNTCCYLQILISHSQRPALMSASCSARRCCPQESPSGAYSCNFAEPRQPHC